MINTTQVAADRAHDETKTVLPAEVARGVYIKNPPSTAALKLMHLLIGKAGGRMADDVRHDIRLSDVRQVEGMKNHDKASLQPLFEELASTVMTHDDPDNMILTIGGLMDRAKLDYRHEVSGDLLVSWWFGGAFREMAAKSCHWAIIDRQTVFALSSKYSILLFQHLSSLVNLDHVTSKTFTVPELRSVLGVPEGKLKQFGHFNDRALKPALAEISALSRFNLTATVNKIGRTAASVTIAWEAKPDPTETKRELDRPKVGRKARLDGTAETIALSFPASGSIKYAAGPWMDCDNPSGKDRDLIAQAFRSWCASKGIALDATGIEKRWASFVAGVKL